MSGIMEWKKKLDDDLIAVAWMGESQRAASLIRKGADPGARNKLGNQPLHIAAQKGYRAMAELLVASGAKIDAGGADDWQPLHFAAAYGHKDVVEFLLARGALVDAAEIHGWQPLHYAAQNADREIVKFLLAHDADPAAVTGDGKTPQTLCPKRRLRILLEKAVREWPAREEARKREAMSEHLKRQRALGSLRPKAPGL